MASTQLPVLLVTDPRGHAPTDEEAIADLAAELRQRGVHVLSSSDLDDARASLRAHPQVGAILLIWSHLPAADRLDELTDFAATIRQRNEHVPLLLLTRRLGINDIPPQMHELLTGAMWFDEDDTDFLANRLMTEIEEHRRVLLPPFFGRLVDYVGEGRYSWHTPGHMGGVAFLHSPVGRVFHDFFGENVLRADLSSSVPELGSVLEHQGVVADAERAAARTFGADETYFVTNGTTMSNQIVFRATVSPGDVVLLDRNCHKSIVNSVIQTGAIPIYLSPLRNRHGMIGPIDPAELAADRIRAKLTKHPLIGDPDRPIRLAVITNSTYDGTMYDVEQLIGALGSQVQYLLLDEAWIPYAAFHPVYQGRFGMSQPASADSPTIFTTMSTHKMLAAFSQASMIHIRQGRVPVPRTRFNEAFMMHTSTSPQYGIVASLDVATKMMEGAGGRALMTDTVQEALDFRAEIGRLADRFGRTDDWWFQAWQPEAPAGGLLPVGDEPGELANAWLMNDRWTGFHGLHSGYAMLDPTKVSLLCPGVAEDGRRQDFGVPAALVAGLLRERGVVVEKTGFYSVLVLFSIGVTRGKSATLVEELLDVKRMIDDNVPVEIALPRLAATFPERYADIGVRDLATEMHAALATADTGEMQEAIYRQLPPVAMTPSQAFDALVRDRIELVPLDKVDGRIAAALCVLYPPGIPVVMPGERMAVEVHPIIDYLQLFEAWDARFPGFETEMQGVVKQPEAGRLAYYVPCVQE